MRIATWISAADLDFDRLWRFTVIALGTLILSACQAPIPVPSPESVSHPMAGYAETGMPGALPGQLPPEAYTGQPPTGYAAAYPAQSQPMPYRPEGPWAPPGIERPWPVDEYMFDGGDREEPAKVGKQWDVHGLHPEDTVAHFDTLDGRTLVEPSNRVQIYAPRFSAVRQVVGIAGDKFHERAPGSGRSGELPAPDARVFSLGCGGAQCAL